MAEEATAADTIIAIARGLLLLLLIIAPTLSLFLLMSFDIKPIYHKIIRLFLCIALPLLLIVIGMAVDMTRININVLDLSVSWYFIIPMVWFGMGIVFYVATAKDI